MHLDSTISQYFLFVMNSRYYCKSCNTQVLQLLGPFKTHSKPARMVSAPVQFSVMFCQAEIFFLCLNPRSFTLYNLSLHHWWQGRHGNLHWILELAVWYYFIHIVPCVWWIWELLKSYCASPLICVVSELILNEVAPFLKVMESITI